MNSYRLTREAERDVIDITLYTIENFGGAQADKYIGEMRDRFQEIAEKPGRGQDFSDIKAGIFRFRSASHHIYYRKEDEGILILRILHGRMDPGRHL